MKRILSLALAAALTFSLSGCGGDSATSDSGETPEGSSYEITMASAQATGTGSNVCGEQFAELVSEASDGRITVVFHQDATLGTELENIQQLKTGEIQMAVFGDIYASSIAAGYDPSFIPFIFNSSEDARAVYEDETLGTAIAEISKENANCYQIGIQNRLPRLLTSSKLIDTPDKLNSVRLRLPEIQEHMTIWNGMGAISTVVALPETYSALQTGVVDAQENPIDLIYSTKFHEVTPYIMMTEHEYSLYHWCINADFFDSLSAEDQALLTDCLNQATAQADEDLTAQNDEIWEKVLAEGGQRIEIDRELWREAATPSIDEVLSGMQQITQDYVTAYIGG